MAEVITETILPGTYIEVRAEGLLAVGAIATGNVGVLGTAEMGDASFANLSSFEQARARFGQPGEWDPASATANLSLIRMLERLFDNGARTVYARRVFDAASSKAASYRLLNEAGAPLLTLRARTPGAWGNRLQVRVEPAEAADAGQPVPNELVARSNGSFILSAERVVQPSGEPGASDVVGRVTVREHGLTTRYQLRTAAPSGQVVQVDPSSRRLAFVTQPGAAAEIRADYLVPATNLRRVTLRYENLQEVYVVPSVAYLRQRLERAEAPSRLVEVAEVHGGGLPRVTAGFQAFTDGSDGKTAPTDLLEQYKAALDQLADQPVQIIAVGAPFSTVRAAVLAHLEKTENLGRERIAVLGADGSGIEKALENAGDVADKRAVLVAPGVRYRDPAGQWIELPPYFAAAAVAGKLASLAPHVSLTNKALAGIDGLAVEYAYGQLTALVQNRVLALERKRGIRVVKGISTDDGAFRQISIRRIVDYAKEGVRQGANQYIGRLNNRRVRENLRTTLDSFLASMLSQEFLTGYRLSVTADRAMEIRGEVLVEMELNPTFSIDVVRVVMTLA
jgi:Phage tail sheath protein subtilisin-like domain/Phage tail sheath C-terminal domain